MLDHARHYCRYSRDLLAEILSQRHAYHVHAGVKGSYPQREERIKAMVGQMFSKPFAEEEALGRRIREQLADFAGQLAQGCKQASASNAKTATTGEAQGYGGSSTGSVKRNTLIHQATNVA